MYINKLIANKTINNNHSGGGKHGGLKWLSAYNLFVP